MSHNENYHSDNDWVFFSEIGHCDFSMSQMIGESESECLKIKKKIREINVQEFFQEKLVSRKFLKVYTVQVGNVMIFPSLRFYVKLITGILEVQNLPFQHI